MFLRGSKNFTAMRRECGNGIDMLMMVRVEECFVEIDRRKSNITMPISLRTQSKFLKQSR